LVLEWVCQQAEVVRVTMAVMARLDLGGSEQAAVGLRKLEVQMAVTMRLGWGGFERAAATLCEQEVKLDFVVFGRAVAKLHLGFERVGARPCKLAVAAVLSLAGLEQAAVVTTRSGLSSLEQAMAKLNAADFEWATAGLGELGTRANAVGLNSDDGAWGQLKRETWW